MSTWQIATAVWFAAAVSLALLVGAAIRIADESCCPHDVDVPDTVPAE